MIIDNSPMTLVTDAAIVGRLTSTNLFVVRTRYSHRRMIDFLNQLVDKKNIENVGIVLNDINPKKYGNYAYRYGGYYGKGSYGPGSGYFEEDSLAKA